MINQKLAEILQQFPKSENRFCFRYSDLTRPAQVRLIKLLKEKSSIERVRSNKISYREMDDALKLADPPIFMNWRGDFNMGQFPRYREQKLSRIIYHLNRKKKEPTTESVQAVVYSSGREIVENLRRTFMPNYMERRAEEQRRALEETMRLGPEGLRNLDERLDEMLTTPMTASEMEHTPRVSNMGTITEESMRDAITAMRNNTGPTPAEIAASRRWIEEAEDARRNRIQVQTRPDGTHWFREYMPDIAEPTITPITIGTDLSFKERNN